MGARSPGGRTEAGDTPRGAGPDVRSALREAPDPPAGSPVGPERLLARRRRAQALVRPGQARQAEDRALIGQAEAPRAPSALRSRASCGSGRRPVEST